MMMKKWVVGLILFGLIGITLLLSAMTGSDTVYPEVSQTATAIAQVLNHRTDYAMTATQTPMPSPTQEAQLPNYGGGGQSEQINNGNARLSEDTSTQRVVIYTANLRIIAQQPNMAVEQIGMLAEDLGGWIVNSNTSVRNRNQTYGTINVRVPAGQLEYVIGAIKGYAVTVTSEMISGDDVTNQYVDMASRLKNLQASETQLQDIMQTADDVEAVLATFRELTRIRGDIESIQGQLSYYDESSTFSAVSVNIDPLIPMSTPYQQPEWNPSKTVDNAIDELEHTTQNVIDGLIHLVIVGGPFALIVLIFGGIGLKIGWAIWKRKR